MTLVIRKLAIEGPLLITPKRFDDARGFFSEIYNARDFSDAGVPFSFVQDSHSLSTERGTVRGLHFQIPPRAQNKLVRVVRGRIFDVIVDVRRGSANFGRHCAVELSADNWQQLFVPVGFAHGFCTLEPDTEVLYKTSDYYAPEAEAGIRWNDAALGIPWPDIAGTKVSERDLGLPLFSSLDVPLSFGE